MSKEKKNPSFAYAVFVMAVSFAFIMIPGAVFGAKIHVMFLLSWLVAIPLCMHLGYTYSELQTGMLKFIPRCIMPVLLILSIGSLIGAWSASGTIAYITVFGLKVINAKLFLATAFVVVLIAASFTGTSFGTVGTIGVALMGVSTGMGINPYMAASAIISAAIIGDGLSPLSDTPNVIAGASDVDMFESVKFQLPMTIPVAILSFLFYLIIGVMAGTQSADTSTITELINGIQTSYNLNLLSIVPIILVFGMLIFKISAIPAILTGSLSALVVAMINQGSSFKSIIDSMWSGFVLESGNALIDSLFSRGGITGMTGTCILIIFSFGLFGILNESKILDTLVEPLAKKINSRISGVVYVIILGFLANFS